MQLAKSVRDVSKFASIGLIDADAPQIQSYIKYFDISLIPATIFFFNAHHMKMDSGYCARTKVFFFMNVLLLGPKFYFRGGNCQVHPVDSFKSAFYSCGHHRTPWSPFFASHENSNVWYMTTPFWECVSFDRTPDHTKWIGAFHSKQDFIDVVEVWCRIC